MLKPVNTIDQKLCIHGIHTLTEMNSLFKNKNNPEKSINQKDICTPMFTAAPYTIGGTWKQLTCPSTNKRIKKMWYIWNIINHEREQNPVIKIQSIMDGPRDYCTEWSKSEREKQILYINTYIWNLKKKWCKWSYCKVEIETSVWIPRVNGGGMNWEMGTDI